MIIYSVRISNPPMTSSDCGMTVGGFAWTLNLVQKKLRMVLLNVSYYLPFRSFRTRIIENHIYELAFS
jgi:hypothetical protein